jgi:hypothetical protein
MRVLIVDVNFDYKNPMYRQFYNNLSYCMDVDYFGPGYVSRKVLEKGIQNYLRENKPYDAILLGKYFVSSSRSDLHYDAYGVHRSTIPFYNVNDAYQCCGRILEELGKVKDVIKLHVYYEDYVLMPKSEFKVCEELLAQGYYMLGWPREYMMKYTPQKLHKYPKLSNYALEIAEKYSAKYIPISFHAINYNEIFTIDFGMRKYEWCIPGNKNKVYYPERSETEIMMIEKGKKIWQDDIYQKLAVGTIEKEHMEWYKFRNKYEKILSYFVGKKKSISSHPQMRYIAACREQYLESMRNTKFVYAEGGIGDSLVRKYFEACASGAVLVAKEASGMAEMGFINGENCIMVEKYQDIATVDEKYTEEQLRKIAENGQRLILEKHMFHYRAEALYKTIESIKNRNYYGAYWKDGNYIIDGD